MAAPLFRQTLAIVDALEGIRANRLAELVVGLAPAAAAAFVGAILDFGTEGNLLGDEQ